MGVLDIYYRAFRNYRRETCDNTSCEKDRKAISSNNADGDKFNTTKYLCRIEEDWVKTIEDGLVFVENAVHEERQFIRTNGEVIPIEKVKRISKDSVEHLAKHSDMLTRLPEEEGDPLVPDKLYMVEKLSDYAVYENRFLYMLLCYLRDFINFRLEKIETLRRTYIGEFTVSKQIVTKKRTLIIKSEINEQRTDNPFPLPDAASAELVKRIKDCQQIVTSLLETDLMVQVAKSPMIKPPIVKTNVLKMNNNFKHALALYDFVATYKGLGYSYEEVKRDFSPFAEKFADEIAESLNLTAYTAYKTGNEIEELLEAEYKREEARREREKAKQVEERIKRLKKRALESNKTLEEYMLLLEERNRALEKDSEQLAVIRGEVDRLLAQIDQLNFEISGLNRRIEELKKVIEEKESEIARLNQKYIEDMAAIKRRHEENLAALNAEHEQEKSVIRTEYEGRLAQQKQEFAEQLASKIDEYEGNVSRLNAQIQQLNDRYDEAVKSYDGQIAALNDKQEELKGQLKRNIDEYEAKAVALRKEYEDKFEVQKQENVFIRSQLDGIRAQQGNLTPSVDHASRERFVELQQEYLAFEKFFKEQWKLTKKQIRKQVLWAKYEKKKPEPNEGPAAVREEQSEIPDSKQTREE